MKNCVLVSFVLSLFCATPLMAGGLDDAQRALNLAKRGETDSAIALFDAALGSPDLNADARTKTHYNKGTVLLDVGRPDLAVMAFDKSLALEPRNEKALINRAEALRLMGKPKESLDSLDQVLKFDRGMAEVHYVRGLNLMALGQASKAEAAFREAIRKENNADYAVGLARSLLVRGKLKDAKEVLDDVLVSNPKHAQAYLYRSLAYKGLGDRRKADNDLAAAARNDYSDPVIRSAYLQRRFGTKPAFYTTRTEIDARTSPQEKAVVLSKLPKDTLIEASSCDGKGWCRAMFGRSLAGYVKKVALSPAFTKP